MYDNWFPDTQTSVSANIVWNIWTLLIVWLVQNQSRVNILKTYDKRPDDRFTKGRKS